MKIKNQNKPAITRLGKAALFASCALLMTTLQASAATIGVDLGADGIQTGATVPPLQWNNMGAFALGSNLGSGQALSMSKSAMIFGDVGIAGNGRLTLQDSAKIQGRLSYFKPGVLTKKNSAQITGPIYNDTPTNSLLTAGVTAANNASTTANGFAATASVAGNKINNVNLTLSVAANTRAVYKLTDLTLNNSYKLTLQGTATSAFVINVSNNFSLSDSAKIQLTGGLTWDHVLFNLTGTKTASMSGSGSLMSGIILATNRKFEMKDSASINGALIANQIVMTDSAKITRPPIVSPF